MISLSERLRMVASLVSPGSSVADIGCDHAHTSIYLIEAGVAERCIAADVRKGPLEAAKRNVSEHKLEENIDIRLSDGLEAIKAGETDTVLISGMGGLLILDILSAYPEKTNKIRELVLSPQSDVDKVREWLYGHGFCITDEKMCRDAGKFYIAIKAINKVLTENAAGVNSTMETLAEESNHTNVENFAFSSILRGKKDPTYLAFLEYELKECEKISDKLKSDTGEKARARLTEIYDETRRLVDEINSMR